MLIPLLRMILDQHVFFTFATRIIIHFSSSLSYNILIIFFIFIRSATPRGTPSERRSSGSGFSFRLNERAEKRKEVADALLKPC